MIHASRKCKWGKYSVLFSNNIIKFEKLNSHISYIHIHFKISLEEGSFKKDEDEIVANHH